MIREVVSGLIIEDKKLLVARKEVNGKNSWILPGGKMKRREHPYETLVRELREELPYMEWNGLWVPEKYFFGISPNNKSSIKVLAYYLDGKTNGDYRPSDSPNEPVKETRLESYSGLLELNLSEVSKQIVEYFRSEGRI